MKNVRNRSVKGLLAEMRRRRVFRVLILYALVGWAVIQVASTVLPNLNVPPWGATLVTVLVVLGLPLAAVIAWAFDVGDGGIRRAVALEPALAPAVPRMIAGDEDRRSIAVLPFVNMSGDPENEYFSDGIAEEILNLLAKLPS